MRVAPNKSSRLDLGETIVQNAEQNPTQAQQNEIAAKSPAKTPAAGTETPDAKTQAREFGKTKVSTSPQSVAAKNPAPLPPIEHGTSGDESGDPVERANARIASVDNKGMAASGNTVDTDGKGLEARREESQWQDNIVYSNATTENYVPIPDEGLVTLDTRAGGTMPVISTREGWRIERRGVVDIDSVNGVRGEQVFSLERVGEGEGDAKK
jgi:hypothetical protein